MKNVGAELAEIALGRLRYPGALIHKVTTLIKWHMFTYEVCHFRQRNQAAGEFIRD